MSGEFKAKFGGLGGDHRYQIGQQPVELSVVMEGTAARLCFIIRADEQGQPIPPKRVHVGTFRNEDAAVTFTSFMDEMLNQVNKAIAHYANPQENDDE